MAPRKKPAEAGVPEVPEVAAPPAAMTDACKKFFVRYEQFPTDKLLSAIRGPFKEALEVVLLAYRELARTKNPEALAGGLIPCANGELATRYCLVTALRFRPGLLAAWHACGEKPSQPVLNILRNSLQLGKIRNLNDRIAERPALQILGELLLAPIEVEGFSGSVERGMSVFRAWVQSEQKYDDMRTLAHASATSYIRVGGTNGAWYLSAFPFDPEIIKPADGATVPDPAVERLPGPARTPGAIPATAARAAAAAPAVAGTIRVDVAEPRWVVLTETVECTQIHRYLAEIPVQVLMDRVTRDGITTGTQFRNLLRELAPTYRGLVYDMSATTDRVVTNTETEDDRGPFGMPEFSGEAITAPTDALRRLREAVR